MARRRKVGPIHRTGGYAKGNTVIDFNGKVIGRIVSKKCSRVRPNERGAWISNERCSYVVEINGRRYVGRGRGEGMAVNLRQSKALNGRSR